MKNTFHLRVMSINGVFFDGEAKSVTLPCADGELMIMAHHEQITAAIYNGELLIETAEAERIRAINGIGYAQAANNRCVVIADTVELPEAIDVLRAKEAAEEAAERMRLKTSMQEYKLAQAAMARALNRIRHASKTYND